MATLKIRYGRDGYRWYPGVRRIQCMGSWGVPDPSDPIGEHNWVATVDQMGNAGGDIQSGAFDQTQTEAQLLAVQVGPTSDPYGGEIYVVVPEGEAWLMGDDGKTIDRIP